VNERISTAASFAAPAKDASRANELSEPTAVLLAGPAKETS
jgi:hypothetical protein